MRFSGESIIEIDGPQLGQGTSNCGGRMNPAGQRGAKVHPGSSEWHIRGASQEEPFFIWFVEFDQNVSSSFVNPLQVTIVDITEIRFTDVVEEY